MQKQHHDEKSAGAICHDIEERAEKGILYKAESVGLEVLSKADEEDIVLGGNASWDIEDDDGDILTVEAQVKALDRFFNQPLEFRDMTANHGRDWAREFKSAIPLQKYTNSKGETVYTHVHEKGTYWISKLRNDSLKATQHLRELARKGMLDGYSVTVVPLLRDGKRVLDMEYQAVTITQKGVMKPRNPMTRNVEVISKSEEEKPSLTAEKALDIEDILQKYGFTNGKKAENTRFLPP